MRITLLLALAIVCFGSTGNAQVRRRWELSATFGKSNGGPTPQVHSAMAAAGLNSTIPAGCFIWCSGPIAHPWSAQGGPTGMFALDYVMAPSWSLRIQWTTADLGEAFGYHEPTGWLFVRSGMASGSAMANLRMGGMFVGVGPALQRVTITRNEYRASSTTQTRIGATIAVGLRLPARSRVFLELVGQQQLVGSVPIGPYTTSDSSATLQRMSGSFSYRTIKFGMGARM